MLFIAGCNVCDGGSSTNEYKPSNIYFSAMTINNDLSSIYGISKDASELAVISTSSDLFSSPSSGYELTYSHLLPPNKKLVNLLNMRDNIDLSISSQDIYGSDSRSVISKDGRFIAIFTNKKAYLYDKANNLTEFLGETISPNSLPAFSPDSKYLAYYLINSAEDFRLRVVNCESRVAVAENVFSSVFRDYNIICFPIWDSRSENVYSIDYKEKDTETLSSININTNEKNNYTIAIGLKSFDISKSDKIIITSRDGNIYLSDLKGGLSNFEKISKINIDEICLYPKFSSSEEDIIFTRYSIPSISQYKGSLYNVNISSKKMTYLFSNVTMGFWS